MEKKLTYSVTLKNGFKGNVECIFDLSLLTPEDILEYALQTIVIKKQAADRKHETLGAVPRTYQVNKPGTRVVSQAAFDIITLLEACGVPQAIGANFAKLRQKDEEPKAFVARLEKMLAGLGMKVDLLSKLSDDEDESEETPEN